MSYPFHNEEFRHGSARWSTDDEVRRAGMFTADGPQVGYLGGRMLRLPGDAPMVSFGGAGSGKTRDLLGYVLCNSPGLPMLILDPPDEEPEKEPEKEDDS